MSTAASPASQPLVFHVIGMVDAGSVSGVEAAVRGVDAAATVAASLPSALVEVRTAAPAETVRQAIEAAGFIAEPSARPLPPPSSFTGRAVGRLLGRALLWGLAWSVLGPLSVLVLMIGIALTDPQCGGPGDAGGCAMGIFSTTVATVPVGAALGFAVTLLSGLFRLRRAPAPT